MSDNRVKKIEKWEIERLRAHPRQRELFPDPSPQEVAELAASLERDGQNHPVEALPDGTLLAGHKRFAAARLLRWTHLDVWVREDLANDQAAADRRLIEDNLVRRQLGPLGIARCYKALRQLQKQNKYSCLRDNGRSELRDRLGEPLGLSGRTLDRLLRILECTPLAVQDAVAAGKLPMTLAEKVASLSRAVREKIAKEIHGGGDVVDVVRKYVTANPTKTKNATDGYIRLLRALHRGLLDLDGRLPQINVDDNPKHEEILSAAEKLIHQLVVALKKQRAPQRRRAPG